MLKKDEEIEQSIPLEWRAVIKEIVDDIRNHTLKPRKINGFKYDVYPSLVEGIYESIDVYGGTLLPLPNDTWKTSICRWMGGHWQVLIDLFMKEEGISDLVLFIDAYEDENSTEFKIQTVHVP